MKCVVIGPTEQTKKCLLEIVKHVEVSALFTIKKEHTAKKSRSVDFESIAQKHGFEIHTDDLKDPNAANIMRSYKPDVLFTFGDSRIIPKEILEIAPLGCIGSHGGPLPDIKGGATMNWAIILGEKKWGVSLFYLVEKVDEGDIIGNERFDITEDDTIETVHAKSDEGILKLLKQILPKIGKEKIETTKNVLVKHRYQLRDKEASNDEIIKWNNDVKAWYYAHKNDGPLFLPLRRPMDGLIDWRRPAKEIYDWIRAQTHPFPGALALLDDKKISVWKAQYSMTNIKDLAPGEAAQAEGKVIVGTGEGNIMLQSVQEEGGKEEDGTRFAGKKFYVPA